jgi:hypothetical protein
VASAPHVGQFEIDVMDITAFRSRGANTLARLGGLDAQTVGVPLEQHQGQREMGDQPPSMFNCRNGLHTIASDTGA